jgi:hypothetical protein
MSPNVWGTIRGFGYFFPLSRGTPGGLPRTLLNNAIPFYIIATITNNLRLNGKYR